MQIVIVAIGNEVLSGAVINSNAAYISHCLEENGWEIARHLVLPDEPAILSYELKVLCETFDLVILTGGLGPTHDDVTRDVIVAIFDTPLVFHESLYEKLMHRYSKVAPWLPKQQSYLPSACQLLENTVGAAPGIIMKKKAMHMVVLPGVPREVQEIVKSGLLPYLIEKYPPKLRKCKRHYNFCLLTESQIDNVLQEIQRKIPNISSGVYPKYGRLVQASLMAYGSEAEKFLEQGEEILLSYFSSKLYSKGQPEIALAIQELFIAQEWRLAFAESCTGGALAAAVTTHPNSSQYFSGSIVSYANSVKEDLLNVTFDYQGAVSEKVALKMAEESLNILKANFSIAVTGIAGPGGGSEEKPVGTVWIAVAEKDSETKTFLIQRQGKRAHIIDYTVNHALSLLWQCAKERLSSCRL